MKQTKRILSLVLSLLMLLMFVSTKSIAKEAPYPVTTTWDGTQSHRSLRNVSLENIGSAFLEGLQNIILAPYTYFLAWTSYLIDSEHPSGFCTGSIWYPTLIFDLIKNGFKTMFKPWRSQSATLALTTSNSDAYVISHFHIPPQRNCSFSGIPGGGYSKYSHISP